MSRQITEALRVDVRAVTRAERLRTAYWHRVRCFLEKYDYIVTPTAGAPAFRLDQPMPSILGDRQIERFRDVFSFGYAFSITGLPVASVPCGFAAERLAVGLQIVGRRLREDAVMEASAAYTVASPEHFTWPFISMDWVAGNPRAADGLPVRRQRRAPAQTCLIGRVLRWAKLRPERNQFLGDEIELTVEVHAGRNQKGRDVETCRSEPRKRRPAVIRVSRHRELIEKRIRHEMRRRHVADERVAKRLGVALSHRRVLEKRLPVQGPEIPRHRRLHRLTGLPPVFTYRHEEEGREGKPAPFHVCADTCGR